MIEQPANFEADRRYARGYTNCQRLIRKAFLFGRWYQTSELRRICCPNSSAESSKHPFTVRTTLQTLLVSVASSTLSVYLRTTYLYHLMWYLCLHAYHATSFNKLSLNAGKISSLTPTSVWICFWKLWIFA